MELGRWIGVRIIENSDNRGSDNRGSTVFISLVVNMTSGEPFSLTYKKKITDFLAIFTLKRVAVEYITE